MFSHAARRPVLHGRAVGHIHHVGGDQHWRQGRGLDQRAGLFEPLAVLVGQCQVATFPRQGQGQGASHAGRRAGDRRHAAVECFHDRLPSAVEGGVAAGRAGALIGTSLTR